MTIAELKTKYNVASIPLQFVVEKPAVKDKNGVILVPAVVSKEWADHFDNEQRIRFVCPAKVAGEIVADRSVNWIKPIEKKKVALESQEKYREVLMLKVEADFDL